MPGEGNVSEMYLKCMDICHVPAKPGSTGRQPRQQFGAQACDPVSASYCLLTSGKSRLLSEPPFPGGKIGTKQ